MPSQDEVNNLKLNWLRDPCWDIENTEGFEDHAEELLEFRLMTEKAQKEKENQKIQEAREAWYSLKLNQSFVINKSCFITRVPNGWVFTSNFNQSSSVFIPFSPMNRTEMGSIT